VDQLGAAPIQVPNLVLPFLGIKNGGRSPSPLGEGMSPTLDQFELLVAAAEVCPGQGAISIPLGGGQAFDAFNVPTRTRWYAREIVAVSGALGAVVGSNAWISIWDTNNFIRAIGDVRTDGFVTGGQINLAIRDVWMRVGDRIGISYTGNGAQTAVAFSVFASVVAFGP
jgi:hypothetical protein